MKKKSLKYRVPTLIQIGDNHVCDCANGSSASNTSSCEGGQGVTADACNSGLGANVGPDIMACKDGDSAVGRNLTCGTGNSAVAESLACSSTGNTPTNTGDSCYTGTSAY